MNATDILMSEHRIIERVLASLEKASRDLQQGKDVRPGFFLDASDFIKGFADGCHHKKEEDVLFPTMIAAGVPAKSGPVAVMLAEHEAGREYVRAMRSAAQRLENGDENARGELFAAVSGYVQLLRDHINKEDHILFPLAGRVIPVAKQDKVSDDFERVEHEETGEGVHEKYLALAEVLEKESGVAISVQ